MHNMALEITGQYLIALRKQRRDQVATPKESDTNQSRVWIFHTATCIAIEFHCLPVKEKR